MELWVVRDSCCGNGNDDSGSVLGVFSTEEAAETFRRRKQTEWYKNPPKYERWREFDVEGPFELDPTSQEQEATPDGN